MVETFVGFHTRLADHEVVDKFIDFIENHLAPMDFNAVIIELNPGYTYRCFPQYSTGTITYEDLQKIAAACRVKGEDMALSKARLALCVAARHAIANCLKIMNITIPEQM